MAYATETELRQALPRGALDALAAAEGGVSLSDKVTRALTDADNTIHAYIGGEYVIPVTDATALAILKTIAISIAGFLLMNHSAATSHEFDNWRSEYIRWIAYLSKIMDGDGVLPGSPSANTSGIIFDNFADQEHRFTDDRLNGGRSLAGISNRWSRSGS